MDSLRKQYKDSVKIRRGVDSLLKSKNFTDDYKSKIKNHIDSPEPASVNFESNVLAKEVDNENQIIISTWEGSAAGWVETPVYISQEVEKAVDTVVDELIPSKPKQREKTVPQGVLDNANKTINDLTLQLKASEDARRAAESEVEKLRAEIATLLQLLDAEKIKTAAANNEAQSSDIRYQETLRDFQKAIQKAIKEATERVSLQGQVAGLQAQRKTLENLLDATKAQLEALNNIIDALKGQISTQQGIIAAEQTQIDFLTQQLAQEQERTQEEQIRQAASEVLDGVPGTFAQKPNSGWKLAQSEITQPDRVMYIRTENDRDVQIRQGNAINFYNFNDTVAQTFTLTVTGDATKWLRVPPSITIPPRQGSVAGKGYVTVQWLNKTDDTDGQRNRVFVGAVTVTTSLGDSHTIRAEYDREVDRPDTWGTRSTLSVNVGSEFV